MGCPSPPLLTLPGVNSFNPMLASTNFPRLFGAVPVLNLMSPSVMTCDHLRHTRTTGILHSHLT
ncbi:hypothetical protein M758_UG172600 [Ceratodon purpureus]|nr:hypothetical protein M758_UG172600 [Ceratodon purpureus]